MIFSAAFGGAYGFIAGSKSEGSGYDPHAFAIGASTSGLAGVYFASQIGTFDPDSFILNYSILVVAYVVFGGMGSLPGAMAGAAVLTWLPEFLKDQVPAEDRQMWIGAIILLAIINLINRGRVR